MGLRLVYESGISGQTTEIGTDRLRAFTFDMTQHAEEGSVAISELQLDDPDGSLDIVGWRQLWAYEDTATGSNSLIHYGWVVDRKVTRGDGRFRTGSGRLWTVSVADQNVTLGFRVITAAQANRPAELDTTRMQWLAGFIDGFGRAPITETEFLFTANGVMMDAVDYRGQTPLDIANDCAQQSGKNFYVYTKDNGYPASQPTRGLWYGFGTHTGYTSPLRLTNVLAEVDGVLTFAISEDTELERKPDRVYSGAYVQYDGGAVYEQVAATYNQFTQRDAVVSAPNVKTRAGATRRALRYLADLDTEEDRITTSVWLPASKVNFVKPGMRIQFKALHLPQYDTAYNYLRVLSKSVKEISEHESLTEPHYLVGLVLSSDEIPAQPVSVPEITTEIEADLLIGSAVHLGLGSDRNQHWASQVGAGTHTMVVGRQYRFLATVTDCLSIPLECSPGVPRNQSHLNAPLIVINDGAASTTVLTDPQVGWTPDACTASSQVHCNDGGITGQWQDNQCGNPEYRVGAVYTGDWLTYDGPAKVADISITATAISGFYGFKWGVNLKLQSRAAP